MTDLLDWLDLSDDAHAAAEAIGNAGPTLRIKDRTLKGYCLDDDGSAGKSYHSSDDLRGYAKGMTEIADWLDARATSPEAPASSKEEGECARPRTSPAPSFDTSGSFRSSEQPALSGYVGPSWMTCSMHTLPCRERKPRRFTTNSIRHKRMAKRPCEADLASDDEDLFAAAMLLCQDGSGRCMSRGSCTFGDCFETEGVSFRDAERRMSRFILDQDDPVVADWLRIGLTAMQASYRVKA